MAKYKAGKKVLIPATIREVIETESGTKYRMLEDFWDPIDENSIKDDPEAEILAANQSFLKQLTERRW